MQKTPFNQWKSHFLKTYAAATFQFVYLLV